MWGNRTEYILQVRLSVGRETSKEDVDRVVAALARAVASLQ